MTREETRLRFKHWCQVTIGNNCNIEDEYMFNNIMALLEQEPREDCISRQAVLDEMYKRRADGDAITVGFIKNLPSVIPQPKTGHWIKEETILGGATGWDGRSYQCSECGRSIHLDTVMEDLTDYPYCHCGARMVGSQESEE